MRLAIIAFALGVWLLQRQAALPGAGTLVAMGLAAAATLIAARWLPWKHPGLRLGLVALAFAAMGFAYAAIFAHVRMAESLDARWEGRDLELTGAIASLPQPFDRGVRFEFDVEDASPAEAQVPGRVLLAWYNGLSREEYQEVMPVRAGERWRFSVRLKRPHGNANPHGFDYEASLLERGIRATGSVRPRGTAERLEDFVPRPAYAIERLREAVRERFWDALPEHRYAGVLIALAIGDQRAIEPPDWEIFTRTGVNHLMSISGLHVTMVSGLVAALAMFGWRRAERLALWLPAQKAGALAGFAAALAYCLIAGFAVPAQRTLYMIGVVALALYLDRFSTASRVLALALGIVLLLDPWAVLAPGFWLSFGAVAVIFFVAAGRARQPHWLAQWGAMQWAVTVGLAPALLAMFQQVSLSSPLANAAAIPLVSLVVTPLALLGAVLPVPLADWTLALAHWLLEALMHLLRWLAALDAAVWRQHAPAAWTLPLALAGVAWLLLPRGFPARALGLLLLAPMLAVAPPLPSSGALWLTVYDAGQGLAVLLRTRNHALLYDAGPSWSPDADSGSRIVVPALRGAGIRGLDALVVSHDDTDHSGGALSVLRAVPTGQLWSSLPASDPITQVPAYRLPCLAGKAWEWDGVRFEFLHPPPAMLADPTEKANNLSCVLKAYAPGGAALLSGDIEARGEAQMVGASGDALRSTVLVAPHHGSNSSSSPAFVAAVAPELAVFAAGYGNRFGHPRPEIVERYRAQGARTLRTDSLGAVEVRIDTDGWSASGYRMRERRYWREF
ncbi:MAG: DNA internalization-related competence protein ComEC/Rec2 [Betaproteobacteria bacterium]|nr:DNA internalization-related competence protein ComEC/Rec2 [Betaproteobacteria bacterium]